MTGSSPVLAMRTKATSDIIKTALDLWLQGIFDRDLVRVPIFQYLLIIYGQKFKTNRHEITLLRRSLYVLPTPAADQRKQ